MPEKTIELDDTKFLKFLDKEISNLKDAPDGDILHYIKGLEEKPKEFNTLCTRIVHRFGLAMDAHGYYPKDIVTFIERDKSIADKLEKKYKLATVKQITETKYFFGLKRGKAKKLSSWIDVFSYIFNRPCYIFISPEFKNKDEKFKRRIRGIDRNFKLTDSKTIIDAESDRQLTDAVKEYIKIIREDIDSNYEKIKNCYFKLKIKKYFSSESKTYIESYDVSESKNGSITLEIEYETNRKNIQSDNEIDIIKHLNKSSKSVILGEPGSGKTTCLKKFFYNSNSIEKFNRGENVIIYLDMAKYDTGEDFIFNVCCLSKVFQPIHIETLLKLNRVSFIFDSINESKSQDECLKEIQKLMYEYPDVRCIVALRAKAWDSSNKLPSNVPVYEIQSIQKKEEQIKFINNYLSDRERSNKIIDALHKNEDTQLMSGNPMFLWLSIQIADENGALPDKPALFYREYFNKWYEEIEVEKKLDNPSPLLKHSNKQNTFEKLIFLAADMRLKGFNKIVPYTYLYNLMKRRKEYTEDFFYFIGQGAICNYNPDSSFGFVHETFQEYLAAEYILTDHEFFKKTRLEKYKFTDPIWDPVIINAMTLEKNKYPEFIKAIFKLRPVLTILLAENIERLRNIQVEFFYSYWNYNIKFMLNPNISEKPKKKSLNELWNDFFMGNTTDRFGSHLLNYSIASYRYNIIKRKWISFFPVKAMIFFDAMEALTEVDIQSYSIELEKCNINPQAICDSIRKNENFNKRIQVWLPGMPFTETYQLFTKPPEFFFHLKEFKDKFQYWINDASIDNFHLLLIYGIANKKDFYKHKKEWIKEADYFYASKLIKLGVATKRDFRYRTFELISKYCEECYSVIPLLESGLVTKNEIEEKISKLIMDAKIEDASKLIEMDIASKEDFCNRITEWIEIADLSTAKKLLKYGFAASDHFNWQKEIWVKEANLAQATTLIDIGLASKNDFSIRISQWIAEANFNQMIDLITYGFASKDLFGKRYFDWLQNANVQMAYNLIVNNIEKIQKFKSLIPIWMQNASYDDAILLARLGVAGRKDFIDRISDWIIEVSIKQATDLVLLKLAEVDDFNEQIPIWTNTISVDEIIALKNAGMIKKEHFIERLRYISAYKDYTSAGNLIDCGLMEIEDFKSRHFLYKKLRRVVINYLWQISIGKLSYLNYTIVFLFVKL